MHTLRNLLAVALVLSARVCHANIHCGLIGFSAFCGLMTLEGSGATGKSIMEVLQIVIDDNNKPDSTQYTEHEHVFCFDNNLALDIPVLGTVHIGGLLQGGICVFPENLQPGGYVTLGQIRQLTEILIRNNCQTCGSIPIGYPSISSDGGPILKFDYVSKATCFGDCITSEDIGNGTDSNPAETAIPGSDITGTGGYGYDSSGCKKSASNSFMNTYVLLLMFVLALLS